MVVNWVVRFSVVQMGSTIVYRYRRKYPLTFSNMVQARVSFEQIFEWIMSFTVFATFTVDWLVLELFISNKIDRNGAKVILYHLNNPPKWPIWSNVSYSSYYMDKPYNIAHIIWSIFNILGLKIYPVHRLDPFKSANLPVLSSPVTLSQKVDLFRLSWFHWGQVR